jgi:DNA-binding NarL/FixJ family response regulator
VVGAGVVTRVFLVDDHRLFLSGVRAELAGRVDIVGEATDVETAVEGIRRTDPDVVLLDVHLPCGGGRAVIETVRPTHPGVVFLALSVSDAAEDVIAVIRAGARGYVTKTIGADDLAAAVERVRDGDAVFSPRLAGFVLDAFAGDLPAGAALDPSSTRSRPASGRSCACSPGATPTRRSPGGSRSPSRPSRRTCPRCSASSSCRRGTS